MTDLNYLTEDEARALWCRHVRQSHWDGDDVQGPYNRMNNEQGEGGSKVPTDCRCIASRCMSWRWRDEGRTHGYCAADGDPAANARVVIGQEKHVIFLPDGPGDLADIRQPDPRLDRERDLREDSSDAV